jgi:hypothetical protein
MQRILKANWSQEQTCNNEPCTSYQLSSLFVLRYSFKLPGSECVIYISGNVAAHMKA